LSKKSKAQGKGETYIYGVSYAEMGASEAVNVTRRVSYVAEIKKKGIPPRSGISEARKEELGITEGGGCGPKFF